MMAESPAPFRPALSIVVPAHDEAEAIDACLRAVLASQGPGAAEVIVVANGCRDDTAARARGWAPAFAEKGWRLVVIERAEGHKPGALNAGDAAARAGVRVYLDADVAVSAPLMAGIATALEGVAPRYASGRLELAPPRRFVTRAYARIYAQVPFLTQGVPGAGLFAVNAAGRARWGAWPDIISDDTFARLNFAPRERVGVAASYRWPLVEGWRALVRVRRRQNRGVAEIAARYPELLRNDDKPRLPARRTLAMALRDPLGFAVYGGVAVATRLGASSGWERGR
jgi:glycosyltransferase involved in cell wall biosynthesis